MIIAKLIDKSFGTEYLWDGQRWTHDPDWDKDASDIDDAICSLLEKMTSDGVPNGYLPDALDKYMAALASQWDMDYEVLVKTSTGEGVVN